MAHNIHHNEQTGKDSFFSVKEKAWHGLGTIVEEYPTSAEAIRFAGLDFTVEKRPLFTHQTESVFDAQEAGTKVADIEVGGHYATVRMDTDTVLGVVGRDYEVIQNVDAFTFFDSIVGGTDGILYETAGALGKGERIFITAKLPDYIRVGRDDLLEKYLFLTTSHNGYGSITAAFTPIRIVCNNTLNAALRNHTNSIKIRHTGNAKDRLVEAHKVLGISNKLSMELEGIFNRWAKVRITDPEVKKLIQMAMVPNKEVLDNLIHGKEDELSSAFQKICTDAYAYTMESPDQCIETTKGTLFGAYNGVVGYFQNMRGYKDKEVKFKSIMTGTAMSRGQTAFDLCASFEKNGKPGLEFN